MQPDRPLNHLVVTILTTLLLLLHIHIRVANANASQIPMRTRSKISVSTSNISCFHVLIVSGPNILASPVPGSSHRKQIAAMAPYKVGVGEEQRFRRVNADTASKYQLQRYDSVHDRFNSRTVSFLRSGLKGL